LRPERVGRVPRTDARIYGGAVRQPPSCDYAGGPSAAGGGKGEEEASGVAAAAAAGAAAAPLRPPAAARLALQPPSRVGGAGGRAAPGRGSHARWPREGAGPLPEADRGLGSSL